MQIDNRFFPRTRLGLYCKRIFVAVCSGKCIGQERKFQISHTREYVSRPPTNRTMVIFDEEDDLLADDQQVAAPAAPPAGPAPPLEGPAAPPTGPAKPEFPSPKKRAAPKKATAKNAAKNLSGKKKLHRENPSAKTPAPKSAANGGGSKNDAAPKENDSDWSMIANSQDSIGLTSWSSSLGFKDFSLE